jgi:cytochrome c556
MQKWMLSFAAVALTATALAATAVTAADDPIKTRKEILKGFGDATKPNAGALKGEVPFNLAAAQAALKAYADGAKKLPDLFPENSKTGGDTEALPAIWQNKQKFLDIYAKLGKDAAAAAAAIKDEATFKAEYPKVLGNCKACHDDFRQKKS